MRWFALIAGTLLVAVAFGAATRVADSRAGLISEVITLLASLAGAGLLLYGLTARRDLPPATAVPHPAEHPGPSSRSRPRTRRDLLLGAGGIALALFLVTGLGLSGDVWWALFGVVLLLPMIAGSVYLCVRFLRASP